MKHRRASSKSRPTRRVQRARIAAAVRRRVAAQKLPTPKLVGMF